MISHFKLPKLNIEKSLYLYSCLNGNRNYDVVFNTAKDTNKLLRNAFKLNWTHFLILINNFFYIIYNYFLIKKK